VTVNADLGATIRRLMAFGTDTLVDQRGTVRG
jgi:hypothetical protein